MARTIEEIKKSMTDKFMSDPILRSAYNISGDSEFENIFSRVSIENILIYIVAVCAYSLEVMFDTFRTEVDELIAQNTVPTIRWYHTQAIKFQYGDALVYDEQAQAFKYAVDDISKQVIKYCAVKDIGGSIQILVSGETNGLPSVLLNDVLMAFKAYMNSVKIAGVILDIRSLQADDIQIDMIIQVDPLQIDMAGKRINDESYPIQEAINRYLQNIVYGGTFNKTKCVDAVQAVAGVLDVTLNEVKVKSSSAQSYTVLVNNNYTAVGGAFIANGLETSLIYVV